MALLKNKNIDAPLSTSELFCNMNGADAFRIIEMYKNIRTSLLFTLSDDKEHVFVLTSAEPNSGKSVTTANLSLSFSQTGAKTLIIDCDMRNPSQHKIFGIENTQGLSNVLSNMCTFEDALKVDVHENLDILTAGQTPPNPSELLGSNSMKHLLDKVKTQYDFVLLDSPPVELVSDTAALLLNAPQAIVIARQNHAVYPEVIHTVETIKGVGGKILGAVLTDVRESGKSYSYATGLYSRYSKYNRYSSYSRYGRYGHYGHYGYGYGYGYGQPGGQFSTPKVSKATKRASKKKDYKYSNTEKAEKGNKNNKTDNKE